MCLSPLLFFIFFIFFGFFGFFIYIPGRDRRAQGLKEREGGKYSGHECD